MIEVKGNEKKLKHDSEIISVLSKVAVSDCKIAFNNFIELLGIPRESLDNIFDTKVIIDYSNEHSIDDYLSLYICDKHGNNAIYVLADYIDNIITKIDKNEEDDCSIYELPITLMHEYLHVNREIMVKETNHEDIEYDDLLTKKLLEGKKDNIILLSVREDNDNYLAKVYNSYTNSYETYCLDKNKFNYKDKTKLFRKIEKYIKSGYYINKLFYLDEPDLEPIDKVNLNDESTINSCCDFDNSVLMEEPLIEAFSRIIINHKYGRELKIKETCIEEINNPENPYDLKIAFNLIYYMNLDTIKWFILSSYDDEYRNRLKEIFNENYGLLLDYFASPKESYDKALDLISLTLKKND